MKELTNREKEVLDFIISFRSEHNYSPSFREICVGCYLGSLSSAKYYVNQLVIKHAIDYVPRRARSITIKFEQVV